MKKPFKTAPGKFGKQPKPRDSHARHDARSEPRGDDRKGGFKKDGPQREGFRKNSLKKDAPRFDRHGSAKLRTDGTKPDRKYHKQGFTTRPTLRINLGAIKANYLAVQKQIGDSVKIGASVKADAYGLGAETVSRTLYGAGCRTFFVATAGEGKIVREAIGDNASIYVLNGPAPQDLTLYFTYTLKPVINSIDQARTWLAEANRAKHAPFTALHIDTGMNRLGLSERDVNELSKDTAMWKALGPDLIMSHLACAPDANNPMNAEQLARFRKLAAQFPVTPLSLANSAGVYLGRDYHFQMVRPGISLYGGQATKKMAQEKIMPVMSLMAPVLQIREVKAGETIGYNATYRAEANMRIAVLGAGYADGIPVAASGSTGGSGKPKSSFVTLGKQRVPIVGRVSMDLTIVDITRLKTPPALGDWAEFRGDNLTHDANAIGTINYELLVRLGQRCRRTYQKG